MHFPMDQEVRAAPNLTVREIKDEIRRTATLHQSALPLHELNELEALLNHDRDVLHLALLPTGTSPGHWLKGVVKKVVARCSRWLWRRQVAFNDVVAENASETTRLLGTLDGNVVDLAGVVVALQREVEHLRARQALSDRKIANLNASLMAQRRRRTRDGVGQVSNLPEIPEPGPTVDYFLLENQLRGPREELLQRHKVYVDYFRNADKVVDIGCGRGELVELLEAEGIPVWGVDADPDMADYCRERGLPVTKADGVEYLAELEDDSLGGVFLARVVEHLTPDAATQLFQVCWAKLRSGGVLVVETINPDCPAALAAFHDNPTRLRPVPAELLRFLLESQGFDVQSTVYTAPISRESPPCVRFGDGVVGDAALYHDYALVGRK
jgi:2-polyprenyl-3-methyl-5-hydroxy-6-metoxy-1,4-benzoquinol methylase